LLQRLLRRVGRYFAARFTNVSRSEAWGYLVWGLVGVAVAVPEIWAAASGDAFIWPTISGTVGHLEDRAAIVALAPVALLAGAALSVARFSEVGRVFVQQDLEALGRTAEGRLAKLGNVMGGPTETLDDAEPAPTPNLIAEPESAFSDRRTWPVLSYVLPATAIIALGSLAAAAAKNKWLTGYVMYSLIAVLGIVIPNVIAYSQRTRTDVPFTTMFATLRNLERRLHFTAIVIAAGVAILLIHLAVYPWPDLARESASYAGLTPSKARDKASEALAQKGITAFDVSAQNKGVFNGRKIWFVYFLADDKYSDCFVRVSKGSSHVEDACGG
jgi:hypothetical protein